MANPFIEGTNVRKKIINDDRCIYSDCLYEQSKKFVSLFGEYQEIHDGVIRDTGCGLSLQQGELGESEEGFPLGDIHRE